jgi:NADH-quinone oxidoreductase subunit C
VRAPERARLEAVLGAAAGGAIEIDESFDGCTVDVPAEAWVACLTAARDDLRCTYLDFLAAWDDTQGRHGETFAVVAHVVDPRGGVHLLLRTRVPREHPTLPSAVGVYRGAAWHEREAFEMYGIEFDGYHDPHGPLRSLLLPEGFEGNPLRKDFVLAARVAKAWPGAKEPGESGHDAAPARRRVRPPGVPEGWGETPTADAPTAPASAAQTPAAPAAERRPRRAPAAGDPSVDPGSDA